MIGLIFLGIFFFGNCRDHSWLGEEEGIPASTWLHYFGRSSKTGSPGVRAGQDPQDGQGDLEDWDPVM